MTDSETKYSVRIVQKIDELQPGEEFDLTKSVNPKRMDEFIGVVKEFINTELDVKQGYSLVFNDDYTKFKKVRA